MQGKTGVGTGDTIELQQRDLEVLAGLFECRVMTIGHIADLYFEGRTEAAKKRLQKLKRAGWIADRPRRSTEPGPVCLTSRSIALLDEQGLLSRYPPIGPLALKKRTQVSDLTLRHELEVVSVKAAFARAVRARPSLTLAECSTWPLLNQFVVPRRVVEPEGRGELLVKPDGFLRIHETQADGAVDEHTFFIEVDRSTESLEVLARKALAYGHYHRSGGFAERCGGERTEFADFPFRVLFVMQSEVRRDNVARRLLENDPPTLTQVWVSTAAEVFMDPFDAVWVRPADYRLDRSRGAASEDCRRTTVVTRLLGND
jgi:Replication-relaxation